MHGHVPVARINQHALWLRGAGEEKSRRNHPMEPYRFRPRKENVVERTNELVRRKTLVNANVP